MSKTNLMAILTTFAAVCKHRNKNEQDYIVPAEGTYRQKADMCMERCKLIAKAFNGDQKIKLADTSQRKHYPCFWIEEDSEAPGGFRLSFLGSGYDGDASRLGVRPYYVEEAHSDFAGETFLAEYEALLQNEAMALLEE